MNNQSDDEMMNSIIGLGEKSIRKSYYPQLKNKLQEIEELNKNLEEIVKLRTNELEEQKNIFETLFNQTSDAIALIKDGEFIDCNYAVLNLLEYENKELFLNLKPHEISPTYQPDGELSSKKEKWLIQECLDNNKIRFEWVHKKSNNEEFWVDVSLTKIILNDENIVHVVLRDITDKKRLEEEVIKRNEELEESNDELYATIKNLKETQKKLIETEKMASLGEVVTGIVKELNSPVDIAVTSGTFLSHSIERIQDESEKKIISQEEFDLLKDLCDTVNENLSSIAKLIRYFQQIKIIKNENQKRVFNINEYMHGILLSMEHMIDEKKVQVTINCKKDLQINTNADDFSKIISTLVLNSIKYAFNTQNKKEITIDIILNNDTLLIGYRDNGDGMDKEHLEKIFVPFFTTSEETHGLGMFIVYNIISSKLNGSIKCRSKKGKGTMFTISIPLN